ncbi:MAG: hypothetical protein AAFN30_20725, partial [Actinomycetota bacterium]
MVALVTSLLATALMTWGVLWYAKRRPVGTPVSWGEALTGSLYVFFLAFLAYGIVPHQWLTLAENELSWRADRILIGPGDLNEPDVKLGLFPFDVTYRTISDSIAGAFYVVFLGGQIWLWSVWQTRDKAAEKA